MHLRPPLVALGAAVALAAALPSSASAAQRCGNVQGKTVLEDARVKVVRVRVKDARLDGSRLLGCARPNGKVFTVGERGTPGDAGPFAGANSVWTFLGARKGTYLVVRRTLGDGAAQTMIEAEWVVNLRSGFKRRFYTGTSGEGSCSGVGDGTGSASESTPPVARIVLNATGPFAVLYAQSGEPTGCYPDAGNAVLVGFRPNGKRVALDRAPVAAIAASSVLVSKTLFSWTNAGVKRSAPARS